MGQAVTQNYCKFCGHPNYPHGSEGCEHVDITEDRTIGSARLGIIPKIVRTSCECDLPHPLLDESRF